MKTFCSAAAASRGSRARLVLLTIALALFGATASMAQPTDERDLAELTLEELLEVEIGHFAITGIHHTHDHPKGEWMLGYSYMFMNMDGNLDGTGSKSKQDIYDDGFMVAPLNMTMQMHMFHLMFAPMDRLTLMLMMPYVVKSMEHRVNPLIPAPFAGQKFTTRSEGPGDFQLSAIIDLWENETHRLIMEGGWSFPTGSIDEKDNLPNTMGADVRLPYPMQLGSGTFDVHPGLTYIGQTRNWSWGLHSDGTLRFGKNDHHYRLGNEWMASVWGARALTRFISTTVRLDGRGWKNIHGADPSLNPMMVPTADPDLRAGERLDIVFGLNLYAPEGRWSGHRLTLEGGLPVYQRLDGPQLETTWQMRVAWELTFDSIFGWRWSL